MFDDAGLFTGDLLKRIAKVLPVVESDCRYDRTRRYNNIGCIEPAAEPDLRATLVREPRRAEVPVEVDVTQVVEFYAR